MSFGSGGNEVSAVSGIKEKFDMSNSLKTDTCLWHADQTTLQSDPLILKAHLKPSSLPAQKNTNANVTVASSFLLL